MIAVRADNTLTTIFPPDGRHDRDGHYMVERMYERLRISDAIELD